MAATRCPDGQCASKKARTWPNERRRARRYKLNWPVRIRGDNAGASSFDEMSTLVDLSSSGAFAYIAYHPSLGSKLFVSIRLPFTKDSWMSYSGTVVRVDVGFAGGGIAIKFDSSRPGFASSQT